MIHSRWGTLGAALLLFLTVPLWSQDYEAPRDSARFMATVAGATAQVQRRALQQKFVIGFNWGEVAHDSLAFKALHIKLVHEGLWPSYSSTSDAYRSLRQWYPWGTGTIHAHPDISQGTLLPYAWAPAMQYDPVVSDRGTVYRFTPRLGDTTGATWGFRVRDTLVGPVMLEDSANSILDNYGRMLLQDTLLKQRNQQLGFPLSTPRLVLSQPSPDELQFYDHIDANRSDFDKVMRHPDNIAPYTRSDMYLLDVRQTQRRVTMKRFFRDSTGSVHYGDTLTVDGPVGFDTVAHGGDTVLMHMRGDSSGWYLAANLRRLANIEQNSVASGIPVLSLRVPMQVRRDTVYYNQYGTADSTHTGITHDTLYARFDSTAVAGNTIVHPQYGIMDNQLAAYDSTVFYIRAGMLPPDTNTVSGQPRPDITLSAHFWLPRFASNDRYRSLHPDRTRHIDLSFAYNGVDGNGEALPQQSEPQGPPVPLPGYPRTVVEPVVERVMMDVTYHGNVDVALDWLRFETRMARMILRGQKDSILIRRTGDWYRYLDSVAPGRSLWTYGHYMADESNPVYWRTQRHISRLLEDAGTTETGSFYRGHYTNQTRDKQHWISWLGPVHTIAAPFLRYGHGDKYDRTASASWLERHDRSLWLNSGYGGIRYKTSSGNDTVVAWDYETVRKHYDTADSLKNKPFMTMNDSLYNVVLRESTSLQGTFEYGMNERVMFAPELLYSNLPVWYNSWLYSEWQTQENTYADKTIRPKTATYTFTRPQTGEEVRAINWLALALGAKGLMPYKGSSSFSSGKGDYGLTLYPSADGKTGRYFPSGQTTGNSGGDFLDSLHTIWQFMNPDSTAQFMGVPKNRIYVGITSMFSALANVHTQVEQIGPELMRLQLQAVYNKGYKLISSRRDSTVDMSRFLNLPYAPGSAVLTDSTLLHPELPRLVRSIHTRTGQNCPECFEHWRDSTFYMITLLKDSAKSLDKEFVLGVVNRRCDPTIYYPPSGGTDFGDSVKFFSTVEFDSLAAGTSLNSLYAYPQYAQYGSREITLPFNYTNSSGFALLHVQEIGGSLDTVIAQNQPLAVKFKPGEGKMLRVSILQPETIVGGRLDYNGQRKIVSWPDPQDTTKLVYHMAFYRTESGRNRVYYSRSEPIARNSDQENVVWNTAIKLSEVVNDENGTPVLQQPDCAYPSIVVRHDPGNESDTTRVYVVFACNAQEDGENIDDDMHYIAENSFPIDADIKDMANNQRNKGYILSQSSGEDLARWGTPVVGAAPEGNFYAWSDSLQGIGVGYKKPKENLLNTALYVRFSESSDSCQHPSIVTYARQELQENTVGLVWQEDNQIYYTRPSYESVLSLQRLPYGNAVFSNAQRVMRLTDDESCLPYNRLPVIYRSAETGAFDSTGSDGKRTLTYDCVVWEGKDSATSNRGKLYRTTVISLDDVRGSVLTTLGGLRATPGGIYGNWYDLAQPDVAQGAVLYRSVNGGSRWLNMSDSAYTLNFSGHFFFQPVKESRIWHVPQRYGSGDGRQVSYSILPSVQLLDHGLFPHLAARKEVTATDSWKLNRRVLQKYGESNITSSAQYFYRSSVVRADDALTPMPGYRKECSKLLVVEPWVNDVPLTLSQPELVVTHDTVLTIKADTIKSNWFTIGSVAEVSFYVMGTDTSLFKASLVRQSNGARQSIPLVIATDTSARLVTQTFTNGGGDNYRLEYIRKDMAAEYVEDMYVGQIALYDSGGSGGGGGGGIGYMKSNSLRPVSSPVIVNLAVAGSDNQVGLHVYAYPNPAKDMVSISVYRTYNETEAVTDRAEHLQVRIVTALGEEVARFEARPGSILNVPVQDMPSGIYFVRVEQRGSITNSETGSTSFVVRR